MTCGVDGCTRLFKSIKTYRNHISDDHSMNSGIINYQPFCSPSAIVADNLTINSDLDDSFEPQVNLSPEISPTLQVSSLKYIISYMFVKINIFF